jgi:hypothetical protein
MRETLAGKYSSEKDMQFSDQFRKTDQMLIGISLQQVNAVTVQRR